MIDKRLERLEDKLDTVISRNGEQAVQLERVASATESNTESLRQHMEQTNLVRNQTQMLFEGLQAMKDEMMQQRMDHRDELNKRIIPLENFMDKVKFAGLVVGILLGLGFGVAKGDLVKAVLSLFL